jgi:Mg2+/Co2+ transporter CorC
VLQTDETVGLVTVTDALEAVTGDRADPLNSEQRADWFRASLRNWTTQDTVHLL